MEWLSDHQWAGWLGVAVALAAVEVFTLDLLFLMLAAGAVAGAVAAGLGAPFLASALVALGVAATTLLLVRPPLVRRLHGGPELTLGHDRLVGRQALVTQQLSALTSGRITVAGEVWTAAPEDSEAVIEPGETVEVREVRGATAYVRRVPPYTP